MRHVSALDSPKLLVELNTTPLIDVMLVLLIMFIITIPMQTHAVKFDLPGGAPPLPIQQANLLTVEASGTVRWNGTAIDMRGLEQELAAVRQAKPSPELHLQPVADARHGQVDAVLAIIKREQISRFGFVGNEAYERVF